MLRHDAGPRLSTYRFARVDGSDQPVIDPATELCAIDGLIVEGNIDMRFQTGIRSGAIGSWSFACRSSGVQFLVKTSALCGWLQEKAKQTNVDRRVPEPALKERF